MTLGSERAAARNRAVEGNGSRGEPQPFVPRARSAAGGVAELEFSCPYESRSATGRADAAFALGALGVAMNGYRRSEKLRVRYRHPAGPGEHTCVELELVSDTRFEDLVASLQRTVEGGAASHGLAAAEPEPEGERVGFGYGADREATGGDGDLDLHLQVWSLPGVMHGRLTYDRRVFADAVAARVASRFSSVLDAAGADPTLRVSSLGELDPAERALLRSWEGTGAPAEAPLPVHELFAAQVALRPEAPALSCRGTVLTYAELDARAERLADWLAAARVGPDAAVAVVIERSPELIVALLGILKAGGCYVVLEPTTPAARLRSLLEDASPVVVLTQERLLAALKGLPAPVVALDAASARLADAPPRPAQHLDPAALAYVSYTSGSTGRPKGVCVPHAAVSRLVRGADWMEMRPDDVFLQISPVAFDASTLEIWGALANGGRLAVHPAGPVVADEVAGVVAAEGVTVLWLTAGLFHQMIDARPDAFAGVRHVLAGGDVLSRAHVERLMRAHPHLLLTNGYGPTENTTFTACWTSDSPPARGSVPIGRPVRGTRVSILGGDLQRVPVGAVGELYACGTGLARCYLGQPAETASRFIPDPHAPDPGERMYRTGDLARWMPDGAIEFLGRADHQVKIQGYRVELGEIEAALIRDPRVADAIVAVQPDASGGKRLLAYVVPAEAVADVAGLTRSLRAELLGHLPAYMVPWAVLPLRSLPLTPNGKVDRRALPAATRMPRSLDDAYVPPSSALEADLAGLWSAMLDVEPVGVHDDFFELGGHSLMAAELAGEIETALDVEVPARTLYLQPTIAELATRIAEMRDAAPAHLHEFRSAP